MNFFYAYLFNFLDLILVTDAGWHCREIGVTEEGNTLTIDSFICGELS
jgi:hypothetical protein